MKVLGRAWPSWLVESAQISSTTTTKKKRPCILRGSHSDGMARMWWMLIRVKVNNVSRAPPQAKHRSRLQGPKEMDTTTDTEYRSEPAVTPIAAQGGSQPQFHRVGKIVIYCRKSRIGWVSSSVSSSPYPQLTDWISRRDDGMTYLLPMHTVFSPWCAKRLSPAT